MADGEGLSDGQGERQESHPPCWGHLIEEHRGVERKAVKALAWMESFSSSVTKAVRVSCDDNHDYVIKGDGISGRTIVTDHVLGQLGVKMGAPVSDICRVHVSEELIAANPGEMGHIPPGLAHGSLYVPRCYPALRLMHYDSEVNRPRFASLAIFFGWSEANDRQFCYQSPDHRVYSFDHGHFLPHGPFWDRGFLEEAADPAPDPELVVGCQLKAEEIRVAREGLSRIDRVAIADVISSVPVGWGKVNSDDMEGLAEFLDKRRQLLSA